MKPSAVLLIDLENFYLSREDYFEETAGPGYDRARFGEDLEKLLGFARTMADGLPFTVKRAYANYQAWRAYPDKTRDFYLRLIPDELMQQGVEPVQVFRLSQGRPGPGGKNAADMRMAMDATALLNGVGNVEHFVLVTGDADFIPVILELKRHGHTVSVIGVTGATNELIQRFVDNFELFEDLIEAETFVARTGDLAAGDGLAPIGEAIRTLLARTGRVRFKTLKPLLLKLLKHAFDPGAFGCETVLDFLRKYAAELGVVIRPVQNDFEIDLPGAAPPPNGPGSSKGSPKPVPRVAEKPLEKQPRPAAKSPKAPARVPEPHTPAHYTQLLAASAAGRSAPVRVPAVPWSVLVWGCDALVPALTPPTGAPATSIELLPRLNAAAARAIPELAKHLRFIYPILRAGLPVPGADGVYSVPEGTTGEAIRRCVLRTIADVLDRRLAEHGVAGPIRPGVLAAVFQPGAALEAATAEVAAALGDLAPAKGGPEDFHTPTTYQRLLKGGGPRGTENAALTLHCVPWPVVERVCADALPILSASLGGGPVARDRLEARLAEAGKALDPQTDAPVRRAVTMLLVAGELIERDGLIGLNPEVTCAQDLRNRILSFMLQLLQLRLIEGGVTDPIRPAPFAAAVEAGPLTESLVIEIAPAIEWLYRSAPEDEQGPESGAGPVPAPTVSETGAESASDGAAGRAPDAPEPVGTEQGPDSGVVEIRAESELGPDGSAAPALEPSRAAALPTDEPTIAPTRTDWDAYERELPLSASHAHTADPPTAHVREEPAPAAFTQPDPGEIPPLDTGTVPLAAITREVVTAASAHALRQTVGVETGAPGMGAEAVAFAPPVSGSAAATPEPLIGAEDDLVLAVPVASDWLADGDLPLAEETANAPIPPFPEQVISTPSVRPGAAAPRPAPTPPPLPGPQPAAVAKIVPPLLPAFVHHPAVQSPPGPSPPPESA